MSERPVDELEQLKIAFDDLDSDYIDLQQENKRYREAIIQAMKSNIDENYNYDVDKILQQALEGDPHD